MAARPARAAGPKFVQQGLAVLGSEMKLSFIAVARVPGFWGWNMGPDGYMIHLIQTDPDPGGFCLAGSIFGPGMGSAWNG